MGFESCHPAVNFIFFAAALYGTVRFNHPVFLAIAYVCAFAYSVKRCGKRAVAFNLCLLPLILIFALYYSSYHHFGVTVLRQNFIGNNLTVESFVYGLVIGLRFAALCMWLEAIFRIVTSDKVAAIKQDWCNSGHRLSSALPATPRAGALDRVSVLQSQRKIKGLPFRQANQLMKRETFICLYL